MKSNNEWKKWGERDPLYAVATWAGKERGSSQAWTDEEFYELGRSDWLDYSTHWQQHGVKLGHCLEIGCGAGRITKQLAASFQNVTAVDVSQHQLDYAKSRIEASNVQFVMNEGVELPAGDGACDAVFSVYVFQHFESLEDALDVFREVHRVLAFGGSMMIQLPLYELPDMWVSSLFRPAISTSRMLSDTKAAIDRWLLSRGKWRNVMKRLRLNRKDLIGSLSEIGFTEIEFHTFSLRSNGSYSEFAFASKSAKDCLAP